MSDKFDLIFPNANAFYSYYNENEDELVKLYDLSLINIFTGANNSGKSRLIRTFLDSNTIHYEHKSLLKEYLTEFNELINSKKFGGVNSSNNVLFNSFQNDRDEVVFKILNYSELQIDILSGVDFNLNVFRLLTENFHRLSLNYFGSNGFIQLQGEDKERISFLLMQIKKMLQQDFFEEKKKIFIPTLRTAHSIFKKKT
ncbi:hypothetical protein, partial [Chryseobacterium flavum]|uniref:hypothetical protein n=1 Tax=Chryseobacterium flavum TaxID=415851 RepID=UPI0039EA0557